MNKTKIDIQYKTKSSKLPKIKDFNLWASTALTACEFEKPAEICIRIVACDEIKSLNKKFRNKNQATNILSFPYEPEPNDKVILLGDIAICAQIIEQEAKEQNKPLLMHWAHIVIHGCLHIIGYDHQNNTNTKKMENLEIDRLSKLGFQNPYKYYEQNNVDI